MKRWMKAAIAGLAALTPVASFAAIDNSHHDMTHMLTGVQEKCAYCHSKTLASGSVPTVTYGATGNFCLLVCHQGVGSLTGSIPNSPGYFTDTFATVGGLADPAIVSFRNSTLSSHGSTPTLLPNAGSLDPAVAVANTNWPHSSASADMECTTCHAVHDGANPPFLNAPLSAATGNADSFCQKCHTGAAASGTAGRFNDITGVGAHPTEFVFDNAVAQTRNSARGNSTAQGRTIATKAALLTQTPTSAPATVAAFNALGVNWNTGGHFMNHTSLLPAASATGNYLGCYSCHSAHQSGGALLGGQNGTSLLLAPQAVTSGIYANETSSVLCAGCHGAAAANSALVENPGLVANHFHPVNHGTFATVPGAMVHNHQDHGAIANNPNVPATGTFPIPMSSAYAAAGVLKGINGEVICASCHDVHGGVTNLMAIRQIGGMLTTPVPTTQTNSVCVGCHQAGANNATGTVNFHHPGRAVNYATGNGNFIPGTVGRAAWTTIDGLGNLADGLSCPDCHTFQGSATRRTTAHNWN